MPVRQLTVVGLFTALIAVLAQVAVPLPFSPVPVTAQLIGVLLAGALLGSRGAFLAVLAYLLLGASGAPIFAFGKGGLFVLLGPTGGYLWGFLPAAYLSGRILEGCPSPGFFRTAGAVTFALGCTYLAGALQLSAVMGYSASQAAAVGVLPFLPVDLMKAILAAMLAARVKRALRIGGFIHVNRTGRAAIDK